MDNTNLITGVTGQDGYFLTKFLLERGEKVIGLKRRTATDNTINIKKFLPHENFTLVEGDVSDSASTFSLLAEYQPTHIYNLAAQSQVGTSFKQPYYTISADLIGQLNFLESIKNLKTADYNPRIYFASTSETFGKNYDEKDGRKSQGINTSFAPQSPYGVAKLAAYHLTRLYRESYNIFACSGVLFNHESELRGEYFLTRKVTKYVAELYWAKKNGLEIPKLQLGNLDSFRDWSYAGDMVRAMVIMLEQPTPQDYVVSSDECHSVRDFVETAFSKISEFYMDHIEINPEHFRPAEVDYLCGDSSEIRKLGWKPEVSFDQLVELMVRADIERLRTV